MVSFRNVSYSYPKSEKKILDNASFEISKGEFAIIQGAAGAGKSTILHLLTCQSKPDAGEITVGPYEFSGLKRKKIPEYRRSIGCVFEDFKLLEEKTVAENIAFALEVQKKFRSKDITEKTEEIAERCNVLDEMDHFPRELSAGSNQRVAIARALVTEPLVLLMDGAIAQLDDETARMILDLLASENIRGMTVLLMQTTDRFFDFLPKSAKYFRIDSGMVGAGL